MPIITIDIYHNQECITKMSSQYLPAKGDALNLIIADEEKSYRVVDRRFKCRLLGQGHDPDVNIANSYIIDVIPESKNR
jgi:hypothetical protein